MKKLSALVLSLAMVFTLVACGGTSTPSPSASGEPSPSQSVEPTAPAAPITNPDEISDNMNSADGKYQVAFITDVGQLKDKSFNQGTYDGVKLYAYNNGLSYKYISPPTATRPPMRTVSTP